MGNYSIQYYELVVYHNVTASWAIVGSPSKRIGSFILVNRNIWSSDSVETSDVNLSYPGSRRNNFMYWLCSTNVVCVPCHYHNRFNFEKGLDRLREHLLPTSPLCSLIKRLPVTTQSMSAQADFTPTCDGASTFLAAFGHRVVYLERAHSIEINSPYRS